MFVWEQGGGLGHIVPYVSSIRKLQNGGHRVIFAIRDLSRAPLIAKVFGAPCFQTPIQTWSSSRPIRTPLTYAHILHNVGFESLDTLSALVGGWQVLYAAIKPDLVIFEHSPVALLAARTQSFRRIVTGTGFVIPPSVYPLPNLRSWLKVDPEGLRDDEDRIAAIINRLLDRLHSPALNHLADLFAGERIALKTFKELDHYPERKGGDYFGTWISPIGEEPIWPNGPDKKTFVYLKPFPALPSLVSLLIDLKVPTIAYVERAGRSMEEKFSSPFMKFVHVPLDMNRIARECDVAVLNGTHNTAANLLLAGKPTLHLPLFLEQDLTARNIERLGAGINCPNLKAENIRAGFERLLASDTISQAAQKFATEHAFMRAGEQIDRYVHFIEDALA
jgi:UDP:flavonoid glycosyltransferase YjiC (YdhE family)